MRNALHSYRLRAAAVGPRLALDHALQQLTREGRAAPCTTNPAAFVSDDPDDRAHAAQACAFCPALKVCRVYATAAREPAHVWGGIDRTRPRDRSDADL